MPTEFLGDEHGTVSSQLISQLSQQEWMSRAKAAISLKELTAQQPVIAALMKALDDPHFLVRHHAADALKPVKSPETEAALKQWEAGESKRTFA